MKGNIIEYLEKTAERFPEHISYCDETTSLTYNELLNSVKKIASGVIETEIYHRPIVVFLEKSVRAVCVFFGIAWSGNYYTPIDVDMPISRIKRILDTLRPCAIITDEKYLDQVKDFECDASVLLYKDLISSCVDEIVINRVKERVIDTDLLYVLFTSGSTGVPKGVTISHRAVIDFAESVNETFQVTEKERIANQGPFYFDLSVLDLYCPIFSGASMYIVPPDLFKFPIKLLEYLKEKEITMIYWVPSALVLVANLRALRAVELPHLKKITFCGEVMPNKQLNVWRKHIPDALYVNMYGPTETTCASTYYIVDREFDDSDSLPIGVPFKNTEILVLNEEDKLVKGEEIGELCIRGTSLSAGYYNDPQRTDEMFVRNPLQTACIDYIYRTGDLVKYNELGELIYISRKDFQIKHMGHRIELGEIETAISNVKGVTTCCCVYDDDRHKITAFLVDDVTEEYVIQGVKEVIPEYMVPNRIIYLDDLPLNANGKIDRLQLKNML